MRSIERAQPWGEPHFDGGRGVERQQVVEQLDSLGVDDLLGDVLTVGFDPRLERLGIEHVAVELAVAHPLHPVGFGGDDACRL